MGVQFPPGALLNFNFMKKLTPEEIRFLTLRTIGNFLVLGSLFVSFLTFGPAVKTEIVYRYQRLRGIKYIVEENSSLSNQNIPSPTPTPSSAKHSSYFGQVLTKGEIRLLKPVDIDFGIVIPKIAANAKIIPNVDAGNYALYINALKQGVAHALGTKFPGEKGNIYLFAHSTDNFWNVGRYNAIFYLLKELEPGDEVNLFYRGIRYIYIVEKKEIVEASEVSFLTQPSPQEQLTLQTCWPPGTTLKRLIVIARPK